MMPKFRKKPVVIEATQWNETSTLRLELEKGGMDVMGWRGSVTDPEMCCNLRIRTLEGTLNVSAGDWIIKGVKGEFYPCKPEIFAATYEPAE